MGLVDLHGRMPCCFTAVTRWYRSSSLLGGMHVSDANAPTDGDDGLGGRAKHVTAMKRMTNVQALVNCTGAVKRVRSKLEVLL